MQVYEYIYICRLVYVYEVYIFVICIMQLFGGVFLLMCTRSRYYLGKEKKGYGMVEGISFKISRIINCCSLHDLARHKSSLYIYIYIYDYKSKRIKE